MPERVTVLPLPAYTPELNPAEPLWPLVKEGVANDCFKDLKALEKRVCQRSRRVYEDRDLISSRLNYHWWPNG
jgi:hypothetical protein